MKLYLSSYGFGNDIQTLVDAVPSGAIGYISNALDFSGADPERRLKREQEEMGALKHLGLRPEPLDLKAFFGNKSGLKSELARLGAVFVCGGNVFVLRQAMRLSGFDELLMDHRNDPEFVYAGYSAGVCVLASDLRPYALVDDATDVPYAGIDEVILEGIGLLDYAIMPHWRSDHLESEAIEACIQYCEEHGIPYKPLRDGEVIFTVVNSV